MVQIAIYLSRCHCQGLWSDLVSLSCQHAYTVDDLISDGLVVYLGQVFQPPIWIWSDASFVRTTMTVASRSSDCFTAIWPESTGCHRCCLPLLALIENRRRSASVHPNENSPLSFTFQLSTLFERIWISIPWNQCLAFASLPHQAFLSRVTLLLRWLLDWRYHEPVSFAEIREAH